MLNSLGIARIPQSTPGLEYLLVDEGGGEGPAGYVLVSDELTSDLGGKDNLLGLVRQKMPSVVAQENIDPINISKQVTILSVKGSEAAKACEIIAAGKEQIERMFRLLSLA